MAGATAWERGGGGLAYGAVTYPGGDPGRVHRGGQVGTYTGPRMRHTGIRAPLVRVQVQPPPFIVRYPVTYAGYVPENLGFSIGHVFSNIGKAVVKGVKDTGHAVGNAATSSIGKGVLATGLALTGVGLPAAIAIGAGAQAAGGLLKSGGGIKGVETGLVQGAVTGAAGSIAGTVGRAAIGKIQSFRTPDASSASSALDAAMGAKSLIAQNTVAQAGAVLMPGGAPPGTPGIDPNTGLPISIDNSGGGFPAVAGSITSGSGDSAVGSAQIGATALTAVQERAKAAAQAASRAAAQQGAQVADLQAQLAAARQQANDAHAADLQRQLDEAKKQAATAETAANNANKATTQLHKHGPSSSGTDVNSLLQQILQNTSLAQQIPPTPNTPQGTQSLPGPTPVSDGTQPPTAPQEASFGGIPMPVLLLGLGAIVFVSMSGSRSRR